MERAFEVQPANAAIQEELRRLYGRRDGVVPPRVRLTRGALVRMYERGELYRQAIAEILAALKEDPERLDLMVVLCRVYLKNGHKVEATEVAGRLISKLPYCYEANRALAEIIPTTSRAEEAEVFQQRLIEIDPYQAFVATTHPTAAQVPDGSVQIDKLDYQGGESAPDTGWMQNLGISLPSSTQEEETLPEWFQANQPSETEPPTPPQATEAPAAEAEIPEFIRQAGFVPAEGPEQPPEQPFDLPEGGTSEEIASAEIPDWLQSMAPAEQEAPAATATEDEQWLAGLTRGVEDAATPTEEQASEQAIPAETPPQSGAPEIISPIAEAASGTLPDWLTTQETPSGPPAPSETLPDWLNQPPVMPDRNEMADDGLEPGTLPDWIQEISAAETTPGSGELPPAVSEIQPEPETTPVEDSGWLQEITPNELPKNEVETTLPSETLPSDSLADLGETALPAEEVGLPEEPTVSGEIPDWLQGLAPESETPEPVSETTAEPIQPVAGLQNVPDWLSEISTENPIEEPSKVEGAEETPPPLPDWVSGSTSEPTAETGLESTELPDWLAGLQQPIESEQTSGLTEVEKNLEPVSSLEQPDSVGIDEIPSDEQALSEVTLPEPETSVISENGQAEPVKELSIPEQIGEPLAEETIASAEEAQAPTQPIHLRQPEPEGIGETSQPFSGESPATQLEEQPIGLEVESSAIKEELPVHQEEKQSVSEEEETPAPISPAAPAEMPTDLDAALAWMEALAARQGAEEGTLSMNPEDRRDEMPEWLQQEVASAPKTQLPPPPVEAEATLPDVAIQEAGAQVTASEVIPITETGEVSETNRTTELPVEAEPVLPAVEEVLPTTETKEQPYEPQAISESSEETAEISSVEAVAATAGEPPLTEEPEKTLTPEPILPTWLQGIDEESIPSTQTTPEGLSEEATPETPLPEAAPIQQLEVNPAASDLLTTGQGALRHGNIEEALSNYEQLVKQGEMVEETIHDLREAIDRYPMEIPLYQLLGDAYMRTNHLQDAIDAYTKAEKLLR